MNTCTCEAERGEVERLRNALRHAYRALRYEQDILRDLYETLRLLNNRWLLLACAGGTLLSPAIGGFCLVLLIKIWETELKIEVQEKRIEEKKEICDKVKNAYDRAQEEYMACKNSLKPCAGPCESEVKPKLECIKMCQGCEKDYCDTCFDPAIEAWEMKQKEKENV